MLSCIVHARTPLFDSLASCVSVQLSPPLCPWRRQHRQPHACIKHTTHTPGVGEPPPPPGLLWTRGMLCDHIVGASKRPPLAACCCAPRPAAARRLRRRRRAVVERIPRISPVTRSAFLESQCTRLTLLNRRLVSQCALLPSLSLSLCQTKVDAQRCARVVQERRTGA